MTVRVQPREPSPREEDPLPRLGLPTSGTPPLHGEFQESNPYHDERGRFATGPGRRKVSAEKAPVSERAERAKAAYNRCDGHKQRRGEQGEVDCLAALGPTAVKSGNNQPADLTFRVGDKLVAIEHKVICDAKDQRVNMRRDSRQRKEAAVAAEQVETFYTVAFDARDTYYNPDEEEPGEHAARWSGRHVYVAHRARAHTFRSMQPFDSYEEAVAWIRQHVESDEGQEEIRAYREKLKRAGGA